jgi:hypothetical protein
MLVELVRLRPQDGRSSSSGILSPRWYEKPGLLPRER